MKTPALLLFLILPAAAQPGGPLTPPPGPPAPTMKSLDRIEPRTPLVDGAPGIDIAPSGTITISRPGSYHLADNLTVSSGDGIAVKSDNVTLDLLGFSILTTTAGGSGSGISITGSKNVTVKNGRIASGYTFNGTTFTGNGFTYGIHIIENSGNVFLNHLSVRGVQSHGMYGGPDENIVVESCTVDVAGGQGITATLVTGSTVNLSGGIGISARQVTGCRAISQGSVGISATQVHRSYGRTLLTSGVAGGISAEIVSGSIGISGAAAGITGSRSVSDSYGYSNGDNSTSRGIHSAGSVQNSTGVSEGNNGTGITARIVHGSRGSSQSNHGILAEQLVSHSEGLSTSGSNGNGIHSLGSVDHCHGTRNSATGVGRGIYAVESGGRVSNSTGISNRDHGIQSIAVIGSSGYAMTGGGDGINATFVTHSIGSRQSNEAGRYGITASRAVGSIATQGENITQKFDMP